MSPATCGYKAFYRGRETEVHASTSHEAQQLAAKVFKARKAYEVAVVLCEKAGKQVVHAPDF